MLNKAGQVRRFNASAVPVVPFADDCVTWRLFRCQVCVSWFAARQSDRVLSLVPTTSDGEAPLPSLGTSTVVVSGAPACCPAVLLVTLLSSTFGSC